MSLDIIDSIKDAEKQADELVRDAQAKAKQILKDATEMSYRILNEEEENTAKKAEKMISDASLSVQAKCSDIISSAKRDATIVEQKAAAQLDKATDYILNAIREA